MIHLRLLSRAGCRLCDEMREEVDRLLASEPREWEIVDVDSDDGCSFAVAGSSVGVSNSVFRVMLSVSGLRTLDITGGSRIPSTGAERLNPRRLAPSLCWAWDAEGRNLSPEVCF